MVLLVLSGSPGTLAGRGWTLRGCLPEADDGSDGEGEGEAAKTGMLIDAPRGLTVHGGAQPCVTHFTDGNGGLGRRGPPPSRAARI